jgi:hypothetical protein
MSDPSAPSFTNVAKLIAPDDTPKWLSSLLEAWGLQISKDRELQDALPSKAEVRNALIGAEEAAKRLIHVLNDHVLMTFVDNESELAIRNLIQFEIDLGTFARAVAQASSSPAISGPGGNTKRWGNRPAQLVDS